MEEAQAGIKIARRNINNLRYADDSILMEESEEELKSLLMKMQEESEIEEKRDDRMRLWAQSVPTPRAAFKNKVLCSHVVMYISQTQFLWKAWTLNGSVQTASTSNSHFTEQ